MGPLFITLVFIWGWTISHEACSGAKVFTWMVSSVKVVKRVDAAMLAGVLAGGKDGQRCVYKKQRCGLRLGGDGPGARRRKIRVWSIGTRRAARFLFKHTDTYALAALVARIARNACGRVAKDNFIPFHHDTGTLLGTMPLRQAKLLLFTTKISVMRCGPHFRPAAHLVNNRNLRCVHLERVCTIPPSALWDSFLIYTQNKNHT